MECKNLNTLWPRERTSPRNEMRIKHYYALRNVDGTERTVTYLSMPLSADSGYQAGSGEHHPCGGGSNYDPGQHVEGEMDAEVDAGEDDEGPC